MATTGHRRRQKIGILSVYFYHRINTLTLTLLFLCPRLDDRPCSKQICKLKYSAHSIQTQKTQAQFTLAWNRHATSVSQFIGAHACVDTGTYGFRGYF